MVVRGGRAARVESRGSCVLRDGVFRVFGRPRGES